MIIGAMRQVGQGTDASRAGVAMAALLVGLSIMAIMMTVALPAWSHAVRREREIELEWRGGQYERAIRLFQRKFANTFPPSVDLLVEQRFLRKKYKDPITGEDFQVVPVGGPQGSTQSASAPAFGIQGVVSKSRATRLRRIGGASTYDKIIFQGIGGSRVAGQIGAGGGALQPGQNFPNVTRPGLPPNIGPTSTPNPFGPPTSFGAPGGQMPFGSPASPPPGIPMFGAPQPPSPFQAPPTGTTPGMTPSGGTPPFPSGTPIFGGGSTRPPVAPPPAWRPR